MTGNAQRHYKLVAKTLDAVHQQQSRLELVKAVAGLGLVLECACAAVGTMPRSPDEDRPR